MRNRNYCCCCYRLNPKPLTSLCICALRRAWDRGFWALRHPLKNPIGSDLRHSPTKITWLLLLMAMWSRKWLRLLAFRVEQPLFGVINTTISFKEDKNLKMEWFVNGGAMKLPPEESRCTSDSQNRPHEVTTSTKLSHLLHIKFSQTAVFSV